jgi:hypothetical protein
MEIVIYGSEKQLWQRVVSWKVIMQNNLGGNLITCQEDEGC